MRLHGFVNNKQTEVIKKNLLQTSQPMQPSLAVWHALHRRLHHILILHVYTYLSILTAHRRTRYKITRLGTVPFVTPAGTDVLVSRSPAPACSRYRLRERGSARCRHPRSPQVWCAQPWWWRRGVPPLLWADVLTSRSTVRVRNDVIYSWQTENPVTGLPATRPQIIFFN